MKRLTALFLTFALAVQAIAAPAGPAALLTNGSNLPAEHKAALRDAIDVASFYQPLDSDLTAFAAKTAPSGAVVGTTDTQTLTNKTLTAPAISSPTGIVKGDVGLGNVDNTSDANKPVSTAQQTAINNQTAIPKNAINIFEGDSIMAGTGGYTPISTLLSTMSNFANRAGLTNVAVSGSKLNSGATQIVGRYTSTVKPLIDAAIAAGQIPYLHVLIGSNDIAGADVTTANVDTWFAAFESYATTAQGHGARVVIWTVLARSNNANLTVNAINGRIRQSTVFDGVIDTTLVHNDCASTRFTDADGTHPNTAGNTRLAKFINSEMNHLGRGKFQPTIVQDVFTYRYAGPSTASPEGTCYQIDRSLGTVIGTTQPSSYSALNLMLAAPVIRYSTSTGAQQTSGYTGIAQSGGSVIASSTAGDMIIGAPSGNGIGFGTNTSGNTQTLRMRLSDAGDLTMSTGSKVILGAQIRLKSYTVATLPASPTEGDAAYVTDATAPTYLGTLTGGGSVKCPVFYNGSAWVSH